MIDVSVIVPVYNTEKYLEKCLDSIINQTFINYEIIIMNDGSPDNSETIIQEYLTKYPQKIKYYKKENGGLSDARNMGILKSSGKYLMFVDSDDYISEDMIEKLYNCIETQGSDMAICNMIKIDSKNQSTKIINYNPGTVNILEDKKILFNLPCACNKMYNKKLFDNLKFDKNKYYEDLRLINKLYLNCNKVAFIDDFCYYYVERNNSIMHDGNLEKNFEIVEAIQSLIDYYQKENQYKIFQEELEFLMIDNVIISTFVRVIRANKHYYKPLKKYWSFIYGNFPNYKKNKYIKQLSRNRKIVFFFNSHKIYFVTKLLFKLKG